MPYANFCGDEMISSDRVLNTMALTLMKREPFALQ